MDLQDLVNIHLTAENNHRLEDTIATLHEECVFEDRTLGQILHGRQGAAKYYTTWWNAFDLVVMGEKRHWTSESVMIAETHYQGTRIGEFLGITATGKPIDFPQTVFVTFIRWADRGQAFLLRLGDAVTPDRNGRNSGNLGSDEWA